MTTKDQLSQALQEAIRSQNRVEKSTLRMVLAEIKNTEVQKGEPVDEPMVLGIIQKEMKARREAIEEASRADRQDLITAAEAEIRVLEEYLPRPLTDAELEQLVQEVIAESGAATPRDMGRVMGELMPRIKGRADGRRASELVRQYLQG